ncbi:MAG: 30S ribosomal protein S2 [Anaerolineae bacterium]|nr:30S ribosomal protein S2 [Anaerolineae bacterium]
MPTQVTMKALLETGVHFGHRTTKWNPKMKPYIFTERNGIHIIDLQQTLVNLNSYADMLRDKTQKGGTVLFVGTKRQAQDAIAREAERCGMPYVNTRWLGGTLTNWKTIKDRIEALKKLEKRRDNGEFELLSKREAQVLNTKIIKLQERLGGIRNMKKLPDVLLVIDTMREVTAVKEANTLNIPVMALADTNSNPDTIDYVIPANDDAVRAIKLLIGALADAILEGQQMRKPDDFGQDGESSAPVFEAASKYDEVEDDEALLGASTLAKLRNSKLFEEETEE